MALPGLGANLGIEFPPLRMDHGNGIRNGFGSVLDQVVQPIVFSHITEEVFLRPSGEQGDRQCGHGRLKVCGQQRSLMTAFGELADLAHPELVRQLRATLGQLPRYGFASGQRNAVRDELFRPPVPLRELVIGQNGHALPPQLLEQLRAVAFPVEHHGEAVGAWVFRQMPLLLRRLGHVGFQPGNHVLLESGDQPGVHFLVPIQERLAI